jgi:hypothetical protein
MCVQYQNKTLTNSDITLRLLVANTVFNLHLTFKVMEVCRPLETATLTALHVNICPLYLHIFQKVGNN